MYQFEARAIEVAACRTNSRAILWKSARSSVSEKAINGALVHDGGNDDDEGLKA